jgi:hypothetical protein
MRGSAPPAPGRGHSFLEPLDRHDDQGPQKDGDNDIQQKIETLSLKAGLPWIAVGADARQELKEFQESSFFWI